MPWSAGNYTKGNAGSGGWTGDASLGIGIEAGRHDTQDNDFATGIDACIVKDGTNAFSGNVNLGNNRPININAGDASAPAVCVGSDTNTGIFGPAADTWAVATNGTERLRINSTGQVVGQLAGSASAPAICLGNDTNTGLYSASADTVSIATNGTERVTVNSSGNFLIKNTYAEESGANPVFNLENTSTTTADGGVVRFGHNQTSSKPLAEIRAQLVDGAVATRAGDLAFFTSAQATGALSQKAVIKHNGRVGIGTSAPDYFMHIADTSGKLYFGNTIEALDSGANNSGAIYFGIAPSSTTSPTGGIEASWGSSNTNPQISIGIIRDGNRTRTLYSTGTGMQFFVNNVEKARLKTDGEFITGGTTDNGAYNLQCNGTGVWGFGAYVNGSDAALKEDIAPIGNTLDIVKSLNPVMFRYKEEYSRDTNLQPGFIAQELEQVFANEAYKDGIVMQGPEFRSVAYQTLIPILVKSIQELNEKVDALTDRVAELEAA